MISKQCQTMFTQLGGCDSLNPPRPPPPQQFIVHSNSSLVVVIRSFANRSASREPCECRCTYHHHHRAIICQYAINALLNAENFAYTMGNVESASAAGLAPLQTGCMMMIMNEWPSIVVCGQPTWGLINCSTTPPSGRAKKGGGEERGELVGWLAAWFIDKTSC